MAATSALIAVENKIPSISNLVKKRDYDTKVGEIENRMVCLNIKTVLNKTKDYIYHIIIVGADMSSSTKIDNRKKHILILGKGSTQGLEHTFSAESLYLINFTKKNTKFCSSLHYNRANSYLFVTGTEIIKFKAKDSENSAYSFCL